MEEANHSKYQGEKAVAVSVRLKPVGQSDQPAFVNYTHVGFAQGLAYVDFGFLDPALLSAVIQRVQQGEALPSTLRGPEVRVALPLDALVRLHQATHSGCEGPPTHPHRPVVIHPQTKRAHGRTPPTIDLVCPGYSASTVSCY